MNNSVRIFLVLPLAISFVHSSDLNFQTMRSPDSVRVENFIDSAALPGQQPIDASHAPRSIKIVKKYGKYKLDYPVPLFGEWGSKLTVENTKNIFQWDDWGMTFQLNQGLTIWHFQENKFIRFHYRGAYDFNTGTKSGPVVSRLQNPILFYEYDAKSRKWGVLGGWAHESNGQILEDTAGARLYKSLNVGDYDPQDYASMGWDYYWINFTQHPGNWGYSFEYRFHIKQVSEIHWGGTTKRMEDTSFFDGKKHKKIKEVDGIRIQGFWDLKWWEINSLSLGIVLPEIGYGNLSDFYDATIWPIFFQVGLGKTVPVFLSISRGQLANIARFDTVIDWKINLGIQIPTISNQGMNGAHIPYYYRMVKGWFSSGKEVPK